MNAAMEIQTVNHKVPRYQIKPLFKTASESRRERQGLLRVLQAAS